MPLTSQQYLTLKNAILAEPAVAAYVAGGQDNAIKEYYNAASSTLAWREAVPAKDVDEAADYSTFDTIQAGKRDAWGYFLQYAPRDFSKNKNRKVVTDVWGAATAGTTAETILQGATEFATRAEELFGGASGTTGTVTAIKRTWTGRLTDQDIATALRG